MMTNKLVTAFLLVLAACGSDPTATCDLNFASQVNADFGDVKLDGLIEAAAAFGVASRDLDTELQATCNAISSDLGGDSATDTAAACDNASAAIDAVFANNADIVVTIGVTPTVCSASAEAVIDCTAECDASFDATATPPTCEGGELSGGCSGQCSGSCEIEGDVACTGSCSGTCSGSCDATVNATCTGTCTGQCEGTCSATDADGNCEGTCTGTCRGTCSGTIEGSCSGECSGQCQGSCRADVSGTCSGSCSGSCDVEFTEPSCEGGELDVMADADCSAACEAESSFDLQCTDPTVTITFSGAPDVAADVDALVATLEANLGSIIVVAEKSATVIGATGDFVTRLGGATAAAASTSVEAADCLRLAIEAQVEATARIMVSIEASASVSASASGSASN